MEMYRENRGIGKKAEIDPKMVHALRGQGVTWKKISEMLGYGIPCIMRHYKNFQLGNPDVAPIKSIDTPPPVETTTTPVSVPKEEPKSLRTPPEQKKTQTSKPWSADHNPWTLDRLALPKSHEGFHPIWLRKKDPDYVRMREEQGYQIAKCYDYGLKPRESKGDKYRDSSVDETIQRGDLILAELPHDLWVKRQEYKRMKAVKAQARSRDEVERARENLKRDGLDMKVAPEPDHTSFEMPRTYTTLTRP